MELVISSQWKEAILRQYEANMARYPRQKREVEAFLQGKAENFRLCLQYLYGHLHSNDMLSQPAAVLAGFVEATLGAYEELAYMQTIPQEIFFPYVLYHRVNSECLDGSRGVLMAQILPLVRGKHMQDAALAVNAWCYAHVTYTPADDRTLGPLAVLRRSLGRCGEESVLAVAALRAVGIPARQCYCPRWSHCDDNHAWVEIWTDGGWHYLGACEPEAQLDRGWFTAAASRAMLVHTKRWAALGEEAALQRTPLYQEISCTAHYADVKMLTVQIMDRGVPVPYVEAAFQIVNYSETYTLHRGITDEQGRLAFTTGLGDLLVSVFHGGKLLLQKVDLRLCSHVVLDLEQGHTLDALPDVAMDLVPPVGRSDVLPQSENEAHQQLLRECEAARAAIVAGFDGHPAAGNKSEIEAFLADDRYPLSEKEEILRTLRPKDWVDITCQVLWDALDTARPVRALFPPEVYRDHVLAPRIADEMLLPQRSCIRALFPEGFRDPAEILAWMQTHMQILDDYGITDYYPSAYGCLKYRQVPAFAFDYVFVALCRAFRFAARLAPDTGEGEWLDGQWHSIHGNAPAVMLTMEAAAVLNYGEHFTLGRWDGREFLTLRYPGLTLEGSCRLQVAPGLYRILTTTRQIDGTASIHLRHFRVDGDMKIHLQMQPDQTAERLQQASLSLPQGPVAAALEAMRGQAGILMFAEPGKEPTEHLLQEMLECADGFNTRAFPIHIFAARREELENPTLQRVIAAIPTVQTQICRDAEGEAALHRLLRQGDLRLPFVICVDSAGRGVYASANYNIRMAQTLLRVQTIALSQVASTAG